jgi:hypothetical protein
VDCGEDAVIDPFFSTNSQRCGTMRTFPGENSRFLGENHPGSCGQIQKRLWNIWGILKKKDSLGNIETFLGSHGRNRSFGGLFRKSGTTLLLEALIRSRILRTVLDNFEAVLRGLL